MPAIQDFPRFTNPAALRVGLVLQAAPEIDCNEYGMEQGTLKFLTFTENLKSFTPKRATPCSKFKAGDDLTARILRQLDYLGAQTNGKIPDGDCPGVGILEVLCQGAIFDVLDGIYPEYDPAGIANGRTGDDIISPARGTMLKTTSVTFKVRANAHHQIYVGTTKDNIEIGLFTLPQGTQSVTVNNIPINGKTVYVRDIIAVNPPSGNGLLREEEYVYTTAASPSSSSSDDEESVDDLNGKPFGKITTPNFVIASTQQSLTVPIFDESAEGGSGTKKIDALIEYHAIDLHYEYMAEKRVRRPRFLQSSYEIDDTDSFSVPDGVGGTEKVQLLIDRVTINESGSDDLVVGEGTHLFEVVNNPATTWRDKISYIGSGARFEQTPAGQFFHVLETASIQISV